MSPQTETDIIREAISILSATEKSASRYSAEISRLKERERYVREDTYRLGLIGITSSGKSTLVNALLGDELLHAEASPTTNVIVTCRHGKQLKCNVYFYDGRVISAERDDVKGCLEQFCSEQSNPRNGLGVKEIYIESDRIEFPDDLVMIDSPGLDALGHEEHEHLTLETLLPTLDFCIYVLCFKDFDEKKLRDILNIAAHYEKEVIIVMNMSDAVKGSPDHRKSKEEVLLEYWSRAEEVISRSNFKNRPKIGIVQMSALYALEGRASGDENKLGKSGYRQFIGSVSSTLDTVKPCIMGHRLSQLKIELSQIAKEAGEDAGCHVVATVEEFKYGNILSDYKVIRNNFTAILKEIKGNIECIEENIPYSVSADSFEGFMNQIGQEAKNVREALRDYNNAVDMAADALLLDKRTLRPSFSFTESHEEYSTKTQTVIKQVERSKLNPLRWIVSKYKIVETTETVGDDTKNRQVLTGDLSSLRSHIKSIEGNFKTTLAKLKQAVSSYKASFDQRKNESLEAQRYIEIESKLKELAECIVIPEKNSSGAECRFMPSDALVPCSVERKTLSLIRLAEAHILAIHRATIESFLGRPKHNQHRIIVGWDENCEAETAYRFFACGIDCRSIRDGVNRLTDSLSIIHNPAAGALSGDKVRGRDWFFLVNTTQQGSMMKKMKSLDLPSFIHKDDRAFFVVEDLEERRHCNALGESIDAAAGIRAFLPRGCTSGILFNHHNPAFNLVAAEVQNSESLMITDENVLFSNMRRCFPNLMEGITKREIAITIKNLKQYGR